MDIDRHQQGIAGGVWRGHHLQSDQCNTLLCHWQWLQAALDKKEIT